MTDVSTETYLVSGLLLLVALLVGSGLGLVRLALLLGESLPLLTEQLADLTCKTLDMSKQGTRNDLPNLIPGFSSRTLSRVSLAKNM